jgi:hypothetical protein
MITDTMLSSKDLWLKGRRASKQESKREEKGTILYERRDLSRRVSHSFFISYESQYTT